MTQVIARVPDELVAEVDRLVSEGVFDSRSDVIREALTRLIDRLRRDRIGREIVEGYLRVPQTEEEIAWADEATRRMIEEEPW